jgi:hypothetical protein
LDTRVQAAKAGGPDEAGLVGDDDEMDAVTGAQRCVSGPPALTGQDCLPHARMGAEDAHFGEFALVIAVEQYHQA